MILYLTVCSIIKYWFDYPSELKFIKNNWENWQIYVNMVLLFCEREIFMLNNQIKKSIKKNKKSIAHIGCFSVSSI
jgi:hypothetical protein